MEGLTSLQLIHRAGKGRAWTGEAGSMCFVVQKAWWGDRVEED